MKAKNSVPSSKCLAARTKGEFGTFSMYITQPLKIDCRQGEDIADIEDCDCNDDNDGETLSLCDRRNQQPNGKIEVVA